MLNKFKEKQILYPTVIMVLICLVVTAALAGTNLLTKHKIEDITKENEQQAMARIIKADEYSKGEIDGKTYYLAESGGKLEGYIFNMTEKGYGGTISVMVGIGPDGTVKAVEVLDVTSETPGLGQNTAKEDFYGQFKGKSGNLTAAKFGTADGKTEINAVASATISSKAVTKCVNDALKCAEKLSSKKGGTEK